MRNVGTALAALVFGLASMAATEPSASPEILREVGDRFDRAQIEQDRETLGTMVAEEVVFVGSDGVR